MGCRLNNLSKSNMAHFGLGDGFPYILEKVDVSILGSWETLGDINSDNLDWMSDEEIKEDKKLSFKAAVGIAWNGSFCDPLCEDTPIRMYIGNTDLKDNFIGHGLKECTPPSAIVECVSERLSVSMDGWPEVTESQLPPVSYTTLTVTGSGTGYWYGSCDGDDFTDTESTLSGAAVCQLNTTPIIEDGVEYYQVDSGAVVKHDINRLCGDDGVYVSSDAEEDHITQVCNIYRERWHQGRGTITSEVSAYDESTNFDSGSTRVTYTISNIETEEMAIERAELGRYISDDESSIWSVRSTGYFFVKQTCVYKVKCAHLKVGAEYSVMLQINKRTAVQSNFGEWEPVDVDPILFLATSSEHTVDNDGDSIELDHIQGYEYKIDGVIIEKA